MQNFYQQPGNEWDDNPKPTNEKTTKLNWLYDLPIINPTPKLKWLEEAPTKSKPYIKVSCKNCGDTSDCCDCPLSDGFDHYKQNPFTPTQAERTAIFNHSASPDEVMTCVGECVTCTDTTCENHKEYFEFCYDRPDCLGRDGCEFCPRF